MFIEGVLKPNGRINEKRLSPDETGYLAFTNTTSAVVFTNNRIVIDVDSRFLVCLASIPWKSVDSFFVERKSEILEVRIETRGGEGLVFQTPLHAMDEVYISNQILRGVRLAG